MRVANGSNIVADGAIITPYYPGCLLFVVIRYCLAALGPRDLGVEDVTQ